MLKLIKNRLKRKLNDDILHMAWSIIWNVTDQTPINCQRFLNNNGLNYFLRCFRVRSTIYFFIYKNNIL